MRAGKRIFAANQLLLLVFGLVFIERVAGHHRRTAGPACNGRVVGECDVVAPQEFADGLLRVLDQMRVGVQAYRIIVETRCL